MGVGGEHRQPTPLLLIPVWHFTDPFSRSSSYGGLGNLSSSAFGGLGNPSLGKRWPPRLLHRLPLSTWPPWPVREQSRTALDHRESQEGRETKQIKTLSRSFCVKRGLAQGGPTRQRNTPLPSSSTSSTNHVANSLALIWLCCSQQALPAPLFGGNSSINYLTSPFCATMGGFLFSLASFSPCLSLFLFISPTFVCQIGHPVVKMDVIGIDTLWNAEVSLGFSQPSTPEGK